MSTRVVTEIESDAEYADHNNALQAYAYGAGTIYLVAILMKSYFKTALGHCIETF